MSDRNDLELERIFDAPRHLVWEAWTNPEHLKIWWAPRPYQTVEADVDLRPGGAFYTRMVGPDDFDSETAGCFLEMIDGEKVVWTTALGPGYRPVAEGPQGCGALIFTAIMTFEDMGDGRTRYRAVAMHKDAADADTHAQMGFHDGWGTCADQLGEVAKSLGVAA